MEATTSNSTELMLPCRVSYGHSLFYTNDEVRSYQSYLRWMYVDQFDARHVVVSWSLFLLLGIFIPIASQFILSSAPIHHS
ncbi:hypothetical protein B296_00016760 [Ensete ventricosum]|uniref:Uncharacterized protein n=1 Tax=Ensete ventricosum TaxID=4639 RepID=A0A427AZM6_ENSVE|nr:hypothetical protein B296_00016760 [Ensete ventricosum]